jgi:hypothetical protein
VDVEKMTSVYRQTVIVLSLEYVHAVHHVIAVQIENRKNLDPAEH